MIGGLGLQWQASFTIITLLYFYSHYLFASGAAHIGAMYTAFLSVSIAMGTPPLVVRPFLLIWHSLLCCTPCHSHASGFLASSFACSAPAKATYQQLASLPFDAFPPAKCRPPSPWASCPT